LWDVRLGAVDEIKAHARDEVNSLIRDLQEARTKLAIYEEEALKAKSDIDLANTKIRNLGSTVLFEREPTFTILTRRDSFDGCFC
jgi:hypothetical protein